MRYLSSKPRAVCQGLPERSDRGYVARVILHGVLPDLADQVGGRLGSSLLDWSIPLP
jgi:hypothetical protein